MTAHLLIDAGNTRIKWRLCAGGSNQSGVAMTNDVDSDPSEMMGLKKIAASARNLKITASNVAGESIQYALLAAVHPNPIHFVTSTASACGLINQYRQPSQLGSDRFAALIAAHHLHDAMPSSATISNQQAKLVVMAGTAITIDALTADGIFLGGVILPGLAAMQISLGQNTALLPPYQRSTAPSARLTAFACDTLAAIQSGVMDAAVGAIGINIRRLQQTVSSNIEIVASGGAIGAISHAISPPPSIPLTIIDDLVIRGLYLIALEQNQAAAIPPSLLREPD